MHIIAHYQSIYTCTYLTSKAHQQHVYYLFNSVAVIHNTCIVITMPQAVLFAVNSIAVYTVHFYSPMILWRHWFLESTHFLVAYQCFSFSEKPILYIVDTFSFVSIKVLNSAWNVIFVYNLENNPFYNTCKVGE